MSPDQAAMQSETFANPAVRQMLAGALSNNSPTTQGGQIRYRTASPLVNISDQDIDRAINVGMGAGPGTIKRVGLPSSSSLSLPPPPSAEEMARAARTEAVDLASVRGTQPKMEFDKFDKGEHPPALIAGYESKPVAVRKENGEYLIFDGHHRAAQAIADGKQKMDMHVIDAKDYAPQFAGRKAAADNTDVEELLRKLFE